MSWARTAVALWVIAGVAACSNGASDAPSDTTSLTTIVPSTTTTQAPAPEISEEDIAP